MNPKVFVSHASEDKERFVVQLASKLRANGVEAWLDQWEMLPGDSLVDKIFQEGIKDAEAIIIVLSNHSVTKPWVREELNAGIVNRILKGTKIIPVVLDNCEVPESLKSTLWESIKDLNDYDLSFQRILQSIFGVTNKPAIGSKPAYVDSVYHDIGGLTKIDNLILQRSCEYILDTNTNSYTSAQKLFPEENNLGLNRVQISESLEVLEEHRYIKILRFIGAGDLYACQFKVTDSGFEIYLKTYNESYNDIIANVISAIVNENILFNAEISKSCDKPLVLIDHILNLLELNGYIKCSKMLGGAVQIFHVSSSLKRKLS
ncbi:toll/interleukin-1 receptor domain-containing protein [Providencia rettgeri]